MLSNRWRIRLLSLYPPYLGAGVRVRAAADLRTFEVRMKLRRLERYLTPRGRGPSDPRTRARGAGTAHPARAEAAQETARLS